MYQLRIVKGPTGAGESFPLQIGTSYTIGRAESCAVRLPSAGISKQHCRVTILAPNKIEIEDMGSSNGTLVNGVLVKKIQTKTGDAITLHNYTLQIVKVAPELANVIEAPSARIDSPMSFGAVGGNVAAAPPPPKSGIEGFLEKNIYPLADQLAQKVSMPILLVGFLVVWSLLLLLLTVSPFSTKANDRVVRESLSVARLYARQLGRLNQQAIIDQRYADLIYTLDTKKGQTPGVIETKILDTTKGTVLSPPEALGSAISVKEEILATQQERESIIFSQSGDAYVSYPIKIGTSSGNQTVATALVVYNPSKGKITINEMIEQVLNSLLAAAVLGLLFVIFFFRWINGSLVLVSEKIDEALKKGDAVVQTEFLWPELQKLCEQISGALGRASGSSAGGMGGDSTWALGAVEASGTAAAAYSTDLRVIAWNESMARVTGINSGLALGADLEGSSLDMAYTGKIRELVAETSSMPWKAGMRPFEVSGKNYRLSMVSGQGAHFITMTKAED